MDIGELQNAALETAAQHIRGQREANQTSKVKLYCLTAFACVVVICAAVVGCFAIYSQQQTIIEQQYALNMQYSSLMEYVAGSEATTETVDGGDGGTAIKIEGDNNTTAGGDCTKTVRGGNVCA